VAEALVCARQRPPQFPSRPYTPQTPGNSHCTPIAYGYSVQSSTFRRVAFRAPMILDPSRASPEWDLARRERGRENQAGHWTRELPVQSDRHRAAVYPIIPPEAREAARGDLR